MHDVGVCVSTCISHDRHCITCRYIPCMRLQKHSTHHRIHNTHAPCSHPCYPLHPCSLLTPLLFTAPMLSVHTPQCHRPPITPPSPRPSTSCTPCSPCLMGPHPTPWATHGGPPHAQPAVPIPPVPPPTHPHPAPASHPACACCCACIQFSGTVPVSAPRCCWQVPVVIVHRLPMPCMHVCMGFRRRLWGCWCRRGGAWSTWSMCCPGWGCQFERHCSDAEPTHLQVCIHGGDHRAGCDGRVVNMMNTHGGQQHMVNYDHRNHTSPPLYHVNRVANSSIQAGGAR